MTSMPSGGWTPAALPPPSRPESSFKWRVLNSLWLLFPILGCGCLGGFGFLAIGLWARRPRWWIAGILYELAGFAIGFTLGQTENKSGVKAVIYGIASVALLASWLGSIVHGLLINGTWLRWRAGYVPWYAQSPQAPTSLGTPNPGQANLPHPGGTASTSDMHSFPAVPLDVNSVGIDQLAALPGFDAARAQQVVTERHFRGGFRTVDEFAYVAKLAPRELVYLRPHLRCGVPDSG